MLRPSPLPLKKLFACGIAAMTLEKYPRESNWPGRFESHNPPPVGNIAAPVYARPALSTPLGQSAGVKGLPSVFTVPKILKQTKRPVYGVPSGQDGGLSAFPPKSTDAMVGLAAVAAVAKLVGLFVGSALRPTHPSQKRKIPCRASFVSTCALIVARRAEMF